MWGRTRGSERACETRALPCRELGIKVARSRTTAKIIFLHLPIDACLDLLLSNLERASVSCIPSLSQSWTPDLQHLLESKPHEAGLCWSAFALQLTTICGNSIYPRPSCLPKIDLPDWMRLRRQWKMREYERHQGESLQSHPYS